MCPYNVLMFVTQMCKIMSKSHPETVNNTKTLFINRRILKHVTNTILTLHNTLVNTNTVNTYSG